jgi:hypothetical protein
MPAPDVPIACSLGVNELGGRLQEFHDLFAAHLRALERSPARLRLVLDATDGVEAATRDLLAREASCCPFFTFAVGHAAGGLVVDVGVPAEADPTLDGLAWLARTAAGVAP